MSLMASLIENSKVILQPTHYTVTDLACLASLNSTCEAYLQALQQQIQCNDSDR